MFKKNREGRGGQGLGGRHFTQRGRRTVGGIFLFSFRKTFRRNFSGLRPLSPEKGLIVVGGRQTIAKGAFGAQGGHGPVPPAYAPAVRLPKICLSMNIEL